MGNTPYLKAIETKLKKLPNGAKILYFSSQTLFLQYKAVARYLAELDTIYIHKKSANISDEDLIGYLFILAHEITHSTSHPKRLNRTYMKDYSFDSKRSIIQFQKELSDNFTLTPEEFEKQCSNLNSINYCKEEILADKCALALFKKMGLPTHLESVRQHIYIDYYKFKLKHRCKDKELYRRHLRDVNRKVKVTIDYLFDILNLN